MAEIGIIASVVGIAGAGIRLSLYLNTVSCGLGKAAQDIQTISRGVSLFSLMLKQAGTVLQSSESVHSKDAVEVARNVADESKRVFDEISEMLDRVRSKRGDKAVALSLQQRLAWAFKKHRVTYLLAQLESLKLSLSVMLQVLQLGRLMASTSKSDPPEVVTVKSDAVQQERIETQNTIIIRYWQISQLDRLYQASVEEDESATSKAEIEDDVNANGEALSLVSSPSSDLTIKLPSSRESPPSATLAKLSPHSLGDLDQRMRGLQESPREMLDVSEEVVDRLLDQWTLWYTIREQRHRQQKPASKYSPSVQNDCEQESERPYHEKYEDRDDSARGYYLEGTTSDWRKPHSIAARQEAIQRKKNYSNYQASVSAASSDAEDSPQSNVSKKLSSRRHVIDSSSDSSDSEYDRERERRQRRERRRSSAGHAPQTTPEATNAVPNTHKHSASQSSARSNTSAGSGYSQISVNSPNSPRHPPASQRPLATPDQSRLHHSISSPVPMIHTSNAPSPYANPLSQYPSNGLAPAQTYPHPNHYPPTNTRYPGPPPVPRMSIPIVRPTSRDGNLTRSPSRLSPRTSYSRSYSRPDQEYRTYSRYDDDYRSSSRYEDERRLSREKLKTNLREGATKGLLGAGAMAGFLEVLEGLSL